MIQPVWDTTVISHLSPGSALERYALERARTPEQATVTAPSLMEAVRGYEARAQVDRRAAATLGWLTGLTAERVIEVLPFDRVAAIVAGRLRAMHPMAPTGPRRKGPKPEQRAGWVMDIQIAACAWAHGRELASQNRRDFERLRDLIGELYPDAPPLRLADPPAA